MMQSSHAASFQIPRQIALHRAPARLHAHSTHPGEPPSMSRYDDMTSEETHG